MRRIVRAGRPTAASGLACRRQHLLQPLADEAAPADRAGEQVRIVAVVDLAVVEVGQFLTSSASRNVSRFLLLGLFGRREPSGKHLVGADDPELGRRIVDRRPSGRQAQRLGGRIAALGDVGVAHRGQHPRQHVGVGDQCAVPLDRQIPFWPNGSGGPADAQCRDRGCPRRSSTPVRQWLRRFARAGSDAIDEDRLAIRPRWVTRLLRHRPPPGVRQRRRQACRGCATGRRQRHPPPATSATLEPC